MKVSPRLRILFFSFLFPLLFLIGVVVFDLQETIRTVTPPLCTIGLLVMALYLRPGWMIWWACFYSAVVVMSLVNHRIHGLLSSGYVPPEFTSNWFRSAGFVTTSVFCCVFSILMNRLRSKEHQLVRLIQNLPTPVLVSDQAGKIQMMNDKACRFLDIKSAGETTPGFFDLLAPLKGHGRCIARYLSAFSKGDKQPTEIELEFRGKPILGKVELLEGPPKLLVTVLSERI